MVMEKKEENDDDKRDKISDLPDAILHHIFSFLNMEEAIRSSVYSKRWRYLWTSLPTLNFKYKVMISPDDEMEGGLNVNDDDDDDDDDDNDDDDDDDDDDNGACIVCNDEDADAQLERIAGLVDKVFNLRDGSNNIQRFGLICPYLPNTSPVDTWVTSALRSNVQELVIEISFDWIWGNPIATCSRLFNSKSLTFLRLVCCPCFVDSMDLQLPDSVRLPSLKTLFLHNVNFPDDCDVTNKLVSSCPVLESLTIRHCAFWEHINIKISSLSLKHLVFEDNAEIVEGICYAYSVKGSLKLITPNLISFCCEDYISKRYYLEDISSLIKADIFMHQSREKDEYGDHDDEYIPPEMKKTRRAQRMLKFLRAFRNVKDLTLSAAILEVLSGSPDFLEVEPTKLCYLTCLRLKTWLSVDSMPLGIPAMAYLLNISPEMKSLFVEISQIMPGSSNIGVYPDADTSSLCLLDNLELVEIRYAVGYIKEFYFIKLLLKNAKVLKKMVVYTCMKDSPEQAKHLLKFNEELLTFPKASSNVTILFN